MGCDGMGIGRGRGWNEDEDGTGWEWAWNKMEVEWDGDRDGIRWGWDENRMGCEDEMKMGWGWYGVMTHARARKDKHLKTSTQEQAARTASRQQGTSTRRATQKNLDGIIFILYGERQKRHGREQKGQKRKRKQERHH